MRHKSALFALLLGISVLGRRSLVDARLAEARSKAEHEKDACETRGRRARSLHQAQLRESEAKYRAIYENSDDAILLVTPDGAILSANPAACRLFGYPEQELIRLRREDLVDTSDPRLGTAMARRERTGSIRAELTFIRKGGERFEASISGRIFTYAEGKERISLVIHDISGRKWIENALRQSEERFRLLYENAPIGIGRFDLYGNWTFINRKFAEILSYSVDEAMHSDERKVSRHEERRVGAEFCRKLLSGEQDVINRERRLRRLDGSTIWIRGTGKMIRDESGKPQYGIAVLEDITERKRAEEELRQALAQSHYLANHDTLTGLANRTQFADRQRDALAYAQRDGHLVAIHLLDLDRFKFINDTLGHHVGDLLLAEVARRIRSLIRATDVAARLGGDEFAIIQTHLDETEAAGVLAGKLVEEIGRPYQLEGQEVHSGTSIGIALYPHDARKPEQLIKLADLALYEAKERGRHNYQFYSAEMEVAAQQTRAVEKELARALREEQFCLHYQPQFDLTSGRISGIEALIRWQHPQRGLLAATEFIHKAEDAGLMLAICEWTLRTACGQQTRWIRSGLNVPLTLNVSSRQLRHPRFLPMLSRILEQTGLPPSLLQLEFRESVLMDPKIPKNLLHQVKEQGVRISLDDFGTEFTALSCLHKYPLNLIKPGQALVRELPGHEWEAALAKAILGVAQNLKIQVCAEGVEKMDQLTFLKDHGCDAAQGYLFSLPMGQEAMNRMVEEELVRK